MAPSPQDITTALQSHTEVVFKGPERDALSVNYIRKRVENELGLDAGFLVSENWKEKSKNIIKGLVAQLAHDEENGVVAPSPATTELKKGVKRSSPEEKPQPKKRQKTEEESEESDAPKRKKTARPKAAAPAKRQPKKKIERYEDSEDSEDEEEETPSDVSSFDEEEDSDAPKPKKSRAKPQGRDKKRAKSREEVVSDSEDEVSGHDGMSKKMKETSISPERLKKKKRAPKKETIEDSGSDDEAQTSKQAAESLGAREDSKAQDSDSSLSSLIDDGPQKSKRASKDKSKVKAKPAPKELSAAETQIKTLQSQLVKCGVRKIWGIELKQYGDDSAAKIRHLQRMLKDVGMVGRFSEARAREIKEMRELQADLEAVRQGESMWGVDADEGRRPRRAASARKSMRVDSDDEEDDEGENHKSNHRGFKDDNDDESEEGDEDDEGIRNGQGKKKLDRAARAKQDFAFLGDDDESDSD